LISCRHGRCKCGDPGRRDRDDLPGADDLAQPGVHERAREDAYAKNPDQPLPKRTHPSDSKSALTHDGAHHRPSHAKARPVPALLMKRPKEPEKV
jgi:hypothetical protein